MKQHILITGGAGYIGSVIANFFKDKNFDITILDNLSTGNKRNIPHNCKFIKGDISDKNIVSKILRKKIDAVFHLAAFTDVDESNKFPKKYFRNNYENSKIFFNLCFKHNVKLFIFSSTAAVYGNSKTKVSENAKLKPKSAYAKSKLKFEHFIKDYKDKMNIIILRYFNVGGADIKLRSGFNVKKKGTLIVNLCRFFFKNKKFYINGKNHSTRDGTPIRDYIDVNDLAKIHLKLLKKQKNKKYFNILNCGYGKGYTVKEIFKCFVKQSNILKKIEYTKNRPNDISVSVSNINKLKKEVLYNPTGKKLNKMIDLSIKWYKTKL